MNRFRFEAFLSEFPGLAEILEKAHDGKYLDERRVTSIRVARVDTKFLQGKLQEFHHNGSCGETTQWEELWAVSPDGTSVLVQTQNQYHSSSNSAGSSTVENDGEPILEALVGFEDAKFLVLLDRDFDDGWCGTSTPEDTLHIIMYKASRQSSLAEEIAKARKEALMAIRAEADF